MVSSNSNPDLSVDAAVRQLRTVLEEIKAVLGVGPAEEKSLWLQARVERLAREAERLAPDFFSISVRNGSCDR